MAWLRRPTCQAGNSAIVGSGKALPLGLLGDGGVGGFDDLAGAQAAGTDVDPLDSAADDGTDSLDVWVPTALRPNVGMANTHAERRLFVADLTYRRHSDSFENERTNGFTKQQSA